MIKGERSNCSFGRMLVLLFLFMTAIAQAEGFSLEVKGVEDEILVVLPKNLNEERRYPAVFFYHGTNGRPNTSYLRTFASATDWIVVGMGYAQRGPFQLTPEGMAEEIRVLRTVREELIKRARLDPKRIFVSGFSKGGWLSGLLLQQEPSLAGAIILGAGHQYEVPNPQKRLDGKPVFIGVGRQDGNYPFGLRAVLYYRQRGAKPILETWHDLGHNLPSGEAMGLREWLALQVGEKPEEKDFIKELTAISERRNEFERWWELLAFEERPSVQGNPEWKKRVGELRAEWARSPTIAREERILAESQRLLIREISKKTLPGLKEIVEGHLRIVENAQGSPQGEIARHDAQRTGKILNLALQEFEQEERQQKEGEVRPKRDQNRNRFRKPLVR